ncbi:hypothetical protein HMPREF2532_00568 [Bacteroides ovatus]|nr:hypothetical protein M088_4674 [Bacteroides ovatus str. 3725 D1 iv]KXT52083.1 hypothetical protein HMPREF2532_00568 [Bacteroides ovatus]CAG9883273.1 hypothetical protein BOVA711_2087 [Bacteroides ovatus]CAG9916559.1 hypothetical protein BOVA435_2372 [Bacteroides ovatus]CAG9922380.1 hypothetical protein BOVAC16_3521 [Bacteroides ovatus]
MFTSSIAFDDIIRIFYLLYPYVFYKYSGAFDVNMRCFTQ